MKKTAALVLTIAMIATLAACTAGGPPSEAPAQVSDSPAASSVPTPAEATPTEGSKVTVTDFNKEQVEVLVNPKRVAIYDYAILDMLQSVGVEKAGIEQLVVPAKDNLPDALAYYKTAGDDKVLTGGSLFYLDWDVLDLVQPELVILGGRSFGMNASGERLGDEDAARYKSDTMEKYADAAFIKLSMNSSNSDMTADMENNVAALAAIFPEIAPELESKMAELKGRIGDLNSKAQASGKKALFCMMVDQTTLSVFMPGSRFGMLYDDFGFSPVDGDAVAWTDQHGFDVRAEYVLEKNPDVIFLLDRSATVGSGAGAENFLKDPIIARTHAALNSDIYVLTGDAWYTMTGGFTAVETMLADLNQYIDTLS